MALQLTPSAPTPAGPRVRLAVPQARDQSEVLALNRASRALHGGWVSPPTTPAQFARLLARNRQPDFVAFLIRRRSDDVIVGAIEVSQIVLGLFRSAYLGYQIGAPYARQGYMAEALGLVLTHGFGPLRLHRLEANIRPENRASIGLVRQLGFTREGYSRRYLKIGGRWRDHERWAILSEVWRVHRATHRATIRARAVRRDGAADERAGRDRGTRRHLDRVVRLARPSGPAAEPGC